jgi:hypothetical protein
MRDRSCYSPETSPSAAFDASELDVEAVRLWLAEVRRLGVAQAFPLFLTKLDYMSRVLLGPAERIELLRLMKRPLLKLATGLPKPLLRDHSGRETARAVRLEQRLYCLTVKNLRQALADLDRSASFNSAELDKARRWLLRNLFRFLDRQIRFGLIFGQSVPPFTWQTLHDLYSYIIVRRLAMPRAIARRRGRGEDFDPGMEYRRLLLLGLAETLTEGRRFTPELIEEIAAFADRCKLAEPESFLGTLGVFRVDVSRDEPPTKVVGSLTEPFRGWVLIPDAVFFRCLYSEISLHERLEPLFKSSSGRLAH